MKRVKTIEASTDISLNISSSMQKSIQKLVAASMAEFEEYIASDYEESSLDESLLKKIALKYAIKTVETYLKELVNDDPEYTLGDVADECDYHSKAEYEYDKIMKKSK